MNATEVSASASSKRSGSPVLGPDGALNGGGGVGAAASTSVLNDYERSRAKEQALCYPVHGTYFYSLARRRVE